MNILIVEDENTVAARLERLTREYFKDKPHRIRICHTLDDADEYLAEQPIDMLFLDLNLGGLDGFELLKKILCESFHTIVVSAYAERALEAFEYGVLDFIAKPFTQQRFTKALDRFMSYARQSQTKYLAIKRLGTIHTIELEKILYFRGANIYSEAILDTGETLLHDKPLSRLEQVLPTNFERVHKSFVVNFTYLESISRNGNTTNVHLKGGHKIPVSRSLSARLKDKLL